VEGVIVRTYCSAAVGVVLSVIATAPAWADTDLTGKWVGQFNGVEVGIPVQAGPFGYQVGDPRTADGPKFMQTTLHIEIETQKQGLAVGTWNTDEFKQKFACAQISQSQWSCLDSDGRANLEVRSPTEIKVCYFNNLRGAQGAGCALLKKTG
jgi:hypothetical protein